MTADEELQLRRQFLFRKCKSKDELKNWITTFLDIEMPDCLVDEDSNSSPMDMIWEVYSKAMKNDDPEFHRVLYFACRDGFKCQIKGTKLIDQKKGLTPIEEVKKGDTIWSGWSWQKVSATVHDGVKESVEMTLKSGHKSVGSPIHRVWAWERGARPAWKKMSELTGTDLVATGPGPTEVRQDITPKILVDNQEEARLVQIQLAEEGYASEIEKRGDEFLVKTVHKADYLKNVGPEYVTTENGDENNFFWSSVDSIKRGTADFYDLTVENDHSYWSNGVISHNTLGAAIIEVLMLLHLDRDVAHMAAIAQQAQKAQSYVKGFLNRPYLRDFVEGDNIRETKVFRYYNPRTKHSLTREEYKKLSKDEKIKHQEIVKTLNEYNDKERYVKVILCTMASANCVDPKSLVELADGKKVPAILVKAGDRIKSFDTQGFCFVDKEVEFVRTINKSAVKITFSDQTELVLSEDHRLFTTKGFVCAGNLKKQAEIFSRDSVYSSGFKGKYVEYIGPTFLGLTSSKCTACDTFIMNYDNKNFPVCHDCDPVLYDGFRPEDSVRVEKIEKVGTVELVDIHVSSDAPTSHNFFCNGKLVHNSEHVPFFCVSGDTFIQTKNGTLTAKELEEEFRKRPEPILVKTINKDRITYSEVEGVTKGTFNTRKIVTDIGNEIEVSDRHPIKTPDKGFVAAEDLSVGDLVYAYEEERLFKTKVLRNDPLGPNEVFDILLKEHHVYISNGFVSHNCIDELDVVANPAAYEEAKNIPAGRDGKLPITMLTSTRKFSFGLVQKEIDEAAKTGLQIRHWNRIDITEGCPEKRHRPDLPKLPIYRSDETLTAMSEEEYDQLPPGNEKDSYVKDEGFDGCLKNCKLFAVCKGRLATHQKSTSKVLKSIEETTNQFKVNELGMAKAQLLCRKPSSDGLIYSRINKQKHILTPAEVYRKVFGDNPTGNSKWYKKIDLYNDLLQMGVRWYAGIDFGYSHNFAYTHGFRYGNVMYVTDCVSMPGLEPDQMVDAIEPFKKFKPKVYPDKENPQLIKLLKKAGWKCVNWKKRAGSVAGGISVVQMKLNPTLGDEPELYFVHDINEDPTMDLLIKHMCEYHWKKDAAGRPTKVPDEENDDENDSLRYMVMNVFDPKGKMISPGKDLEIKEPPTSIAQGMGERVYSQDNWVREIVAEETGSDPGQGFISKNIAKTGRGGYYSQNNDDDDDRPESSSRIILDI